jgi:hypothetical protein
MTLHSFGNNHPKFQVTFIFFRGAARPPTSKTLNEIVVVFWGAGCFAGTAYQCRQMTGMTGTFLKFVKNVSGHPKILTSGVFPVALTTFHNHLILYNIYMYMFSHMNLDLNVNIYFYTCVLFF